VWVTISQAVAACYVDSTGMNRYCQPAVRPGTVGVLSIKTGWNKMTTVSTPFTQTSGSRCYGPMATPWICITDFVGSGKATKAARHILGEFGRLKYRRDHPSDSRVRCMLCR